MCITKAGRRGRVCGRCPSGRRSVSREQLPQATIEALRAGAHGELKLKLLDKKTWAEAWAKSLV